MALTSARIAAPLQRFLLVTLLVLAFVMGGGARSDIASLVFLRPASFVLLALGLLTLRGDDIARNRIVYLLTALATALAALHLVPLPAGLWHALPGRGLLVEADRLAGLSAVRRPLTMVPAAGWNAFYALGIPIAALVLASQNLARDRTRALTVIIGLGVLSMLLGIVQALGPAGNPLFLYRITNTGLPVGLFANRNHQAVFLAALVPLLVMAATGGKVPIRGNRDYRPIRRAAAIGAGVTAIAVIVLGGSRAGLGTLAFALASIPFVLGASGVQTWSYLAGQRGEANMRGRDRDGRRSPLRRVPWRLVAVTAIVVAAALALATSSRETGFGRLAANEDSRGPMWSVIAGDIANYLPLGSGSGSIVEVFQIAEPDSQLDLSYLNHAHNDLLEIALTFGLPGIALLVAAAAALAITAARLFRDRRNPARQQERAALIVLLILSFASVVDYPERTPSLACLAIVMITWLSPPRADELRERGRVTAGKTEQEVVA